LHDCAQRLKERVLQKYRAKGLSKMKGEELGTQYKLLWILRKEMPLLHKNLPQIQSRDQIKQINKGKKTFFYLKRVIGLLLSLNIHALGSYAFGLRCYLAMRDHRVSQARSNHK
jgi:hypothetical protein